MAITLLGRSTHSASARRVEHVDLWGPRREKLRALVDGPSLPVTRLDPGTPHYFLVPHDRSGEHEYARGYRLPEIMPVHSTVAVTARDSFVVAFSAAELEARIAVLGDFHVSDDEIRRRYFTSGRSTKYPPGDTRGWRLAEARQRVAREPDWRRWIRDCLYRPFDRRKIFWVPWMIDWPRPAVMTHLAAGGKTWPWWRDGKDQRPSRAITSGSPTRSPSTVWCDPTIAAANPYFHSTSWKIPAAKAVTSRSVTAACANPPPRRGPISRPISSIVSRQLDLTWLADAGPTTGDPFTAWELFGYIYALLHAPSYRQRFATWLRIDFPRVFVPAHTSLFRNLSRLGARLIDLHLLRGDPPRHASFEGSWAAARVGAGFPQWAPHRIYVNRDLSIGPVPRQVWEFRVGAYQVCQKWLKDRRGRELQPTDLHHFGRIVAALEDTLTGMRQIDQEIDRHGGWQAAFV